MLTCGVVVVELRGFEPLTPCMPLMLGEFTTPRRTSRNHTTAQVRAAAEGSVVGRREAARSAVSGEFLARLLWHGCGDLRAAALAILREHGQG